ncbi:MAG: ribosome maturation factor RimM [Chitinispirillales bacterium]|jgi:16S rRNA processing protein RimM|nr:ribosome maturation factor RimM [Chitinispirillales bacterium]
MDLIAIAVIKRAVGLQGHCGVMAYGETLGRLDTPAAVYIGESDVRAKEVSILRIELRPQGYVVLLDGINDRDAAEAIQGLSLYVGEDRLPKLADGEDYHFHLKGMNVVSSSTGGPIGTVRDAVNLPSTDALVVMSADGHEIVIPYNNQAVVKVDKVGKVITVDDSYIEELL